MSLRFNVKFTACLLVLGVLCGGGTHFLHGYQVKRNAGVFLERADRAAKEAETAEPAEKAALYRKEAEHLRRYLAFRPRDTEARARLGILLEKFVRTSKDLSNILIVYDTVLRQDPARADIRLRAAKIAMMLGRHADALERLKALGALDSRDSELHTLYGQCLEATGDYKGASSQYAKAVELPPVKLGTYALYAALLRRRSNDAAAADKLMEKMTKDVPTAEAFLVLCNYWKEFDKTKDGAERAARALAEAQKLAPDNAEVLLQSAALARAEEGPNALAKARKFLARGIEVHPRDVRMYQALATLEQGAGQRGEAVAVLRRGLETLPGQVDLLWTLADLRVGDGDESEMGDLIEQMKKGGVMPARLDYLGARLLLSKGRWRETADLLERTRSELEAWPLLMRHSDLLLARCYEKLGELDQQYVAYNRLVTSDPLSIPGNLGLGASLEALGRDEDALKAYQRILRLEGASEARLRVALADPPQPGTSASGATVAGSRSTS